MPVHERVGARATINKLASSKNFLAKFKQAGKKKRDGGGMNFCPPALPRRRCGISPGFVDSRFGFCSRQTAKL